MSICKCLFKNEKTTIAKMMIPKKEIYSAKYPYGKDIENKSKSLSSISKTYNQSKTYVDKMDYLDGKEERK